MFLPQRFAAMALVLSVPLFSMGQQGQSLKWSPEQVYYGSGGRLTYTPDEKGNVIPDFSHVGYMYGDTTIPDVPVVAEVSPVEGDDGANIQAAIDLVEAMTPDGHGFRGAVLLKNGTYQVTGQLTIGASGVVLRGEGNTEDGTVIIAEGTSQRSLIVIGNGSDRSIDESSRVPITEEYVPVGRKFVIVSDASGFTPGDHIALYRPGTQNWISDLRMDQISDPDGTTTQWTPSSYSFYFERRVIKVSGDTLFFRNPMVMAMESTYGGGVVYKVRFDRLQQVGVEDLSLQSAYASETDENHSWKALEFNSIENGWARRVTSWYFAYSCVSLEKDSRLITVLDCHCREPKSAITGGRRYSFNLAGSLNLFKGCTTTEGRHDFVTGSRVCGPNVFTECSAANAHADTGPHHRWAMGTLFDVILTDGAINVQDRDDSGTGHGWAGANQVFWNCTGASSICQSPWVSALNYNFGFLGDKEPGNRPDRPDGVWVGHNRPGIFPESLYAAQLDSRIKDTRLFSVYSELRATSDSSFIIAFNMPFDGSAIQPENFTIGGSAGYAGKEFSIEILEDTLVSIVFDGIGVLPAFSTVIVKAVNMTSSRGDSILGLQHAIYTEPDKRPVVEGNSLEVNNEDGFLEAVSSKPGTIYLVKYPGTYHTVEDLDKAVAQNLGRKEDAPEAGASVPIATNGLPGGYYNYYAVDEEGRVSEPANAWPKVLQTGPLTELQSIRTDNGFSLWSAHSTLHIKPDRTTGTYGIQLFDISGRLIDMKNDLVGEQQVLLSDHHQILIIRIICKTGVITRKVLLSQ